MGRPKILVLMRPFAQRYPKHKHKYDMITAIEEYAEVKYWSEDGNIIDILKQTEFKPDFIFSYDVAADNIFAPDINGLDKIDIPKGCVVNDPQSAPEKREEYFEKNRIDLIFSPTKRGFLSYFPKYESKFRWMPFSINPENIRDWKQEKDIKFLLVGLYYDQHADNFQNKLGFKGAYPFREAVNDKMRTIKGYYTIPHPTHCAPPSENLIANDKYGRLINRSKIFFTCGSVRDFPVAKFFEALGCRTLLLAKPNKDILELGFKDGVNFVACDESDFYEKAIYYIRHDNDRDIITNTGYGFVHLNHTNKIRAKQIIEYIKDIL